MVDDGVGCHWVAVETEESEVESRCVTPVSDKGLLLRASFNDMPILFSFHYFHSMNTTYH